jgi:hypothetical protein
MAIQKIPSVSHTLVRVIRTTSLSITAKEHLRTQQDAQGACQWHQEGQEAALRFLEGCGPQILEKPKILQEIQREQAHAR